MCVYMALSDPLYVSEIVFILCPGDVKKFYEKHS